MKGVTPLKKGADYVTKRMEADSGDAFPEHTASVESVLVLTQGQCLVKFPDADHALEAGDSFVVPADVWHQVVAAPDFSAVHIMPHQIRFEFAD